MDHHVEATEEELVSGALLKDSFAVSAGGCQTPLVPSEVTALSSHFPLPLAGKSRRHVCWRRAKPRWTGSVCQLVNY